MVYGKWRMLRTAVLTSHTVASKNVFSRQFDLPEWNPQVGTQADNGGEWITTPNCSDYLRRAVLDYLCLRKKQQH